VRVKTVSPRDDPEAGASDIPGSQAGAWEPVKGQQAVPEPAQQRPGRRRMPPPRPFAKAMLAGPGPAEAKEQAARTPHSPPPPGCGSPRPLRNHHVEPAARNGTIMSSSLNAGLSRSARSAEGEGGVLAACPPHPSPSSKGIPSAERGGRPGRRVPASAAARRGGLTGLESPGTSPCHCGSAARAGESGSPVAPRAEKARGKGIEATCRRLRCQSSTSISVRPGRLRSDDNCGPKQVRNHAAAPGTGTLSSPARRVAGTYQEGDPTRMWSAG